jgi:hypothetical protein
MGTAHIVSVSPDARHPQSCDVTYEPQTNRIKAVVAETWLVTTDTDHIWMPFDIVGVSDGTFTLPSPGTTYSLPPSGAIVVCDKCDVKSEPATPYAFEVSMGFYLYSLPEATAKLTLKSVAYPQTVYYDKDNNPIVNSAGQSFDPALTKTFYDIQFTMTWQSFTVPPISTIYGALGQTNSDSVTLGAGGWTQSFTERQLKLDDADVSFEYQGSTPIWSGSVTMTARSDTFVDKLLDEGYCTRNGSGQLVTITDANGDPLNSPARLNGSGGLQTGTGGTYLTFSVEDETAFSSIVSAIV